MLNPTGDDDDIVGARPKSAPAGDEEGQRSWPMLPNMVPQDEDIEEEIADLVASNDRQWKELTSIVNGTKKQMTSLFKLTEQKDRVAAATDRDRQLQRQAALKAAEVDEKNLAFTTVTKRIEEKYSRGVGTVPRMPSSWKTGDIAMRARGGGLCEVLKVFPGMSPPCCEVRVIQSGLMVNMEIRNISALPPPEEKSARELRDAVELARKEQNKTKDDLAKAKQQLVEEHKIFKDRLEGELRREREASLASQACITPTAAAPPGMPELDNTRVMKVQHWIDDTPYVPVFDGKAAGAHVISTPSTTYGTGASGDTHASVADVTPPAPTASAAPAGPGPEVPFLPQPTPGEPVTGEESESAALWGAAAPKTGWLSYTTEEGDTYYYHPVTGTTAWDLPKGAVAKPADEVEAGGVDATASQELPKADAAAPAAAAEPATANPAPQATAAASEPMATAAAAPQSFGPTAAATSPVAAAAAPAPAPAASTVPPAMQLPGERKRLSHRGVEQAPMPQPQPQQQQQQQQQLQLQLQQDNQAKQNELQQQALQLQQQAQQLQQQQMQLQLQQQQLELQMQQQQIQNQIQQLQQQQQQLQQPQAPLMSQQLPGQSPFGMAPQLPVQSPFAAAPQLPANDWAMAHAADGTPYWYSPSTGESRWEAPGVAPASTEYDPWAGLGQVEQQFVNQQQEQWAQWFSEYSKWFQSQFQAQNALPGSKVPKLTEPREDASADEKMAYAVKSYVLKEMIGMMEEDAPVSQRKKALKSLQVRWHPDKNADKLAVAKDIFQFIGETKHWFLAGEDDLSPCSGGSPVSPAFGGGMS